MTIAVILAGGSGSRFGADRPKQFLEVAGKTIIEHTVEAFHRNDGVDEIAVVTRKDFVDDVREMLKGYPKVRKVLEGGKERYHSSLAAIAAYTAADDCLLIHDCVRPLVSQRIINDCLQALKDYDAVNVAVPATDTIIETDEQGLISRIPERRLLRNVQTPQCFRREVLAAAFDKALADEQFQPTDDCSVVFRYAPSTPIYIVKGETTNIKVTYPEDLQFVESELKKQK